MVANRLQTLRHIRQSLCGLRVIRSSHGLGERKRFPGEFQPSLRVTGSCMEPPGGAENAYEMFSSALVALADFECSLGVCYGRRESSCARLAGHEPDQIVE